MTIFRSCRSTPNEAKCIKPRQKVYRYTHLAIIHGVSRVIAGDKAADKDRSTQFLHLWIPSRRGGQPPRWGVEDASGGMAAGYLRNHDRSHLPEGPSNPQLAFSLMVG